MEKDEKKMRSVFATLNAINVQEHVEVKDTGRVKLSYLSWAWAWAEVKKAYPDAFYTIYENKDGWCYHTDGHTAWVKTGVTIEGIEHIEYLPVMDNRNASIPCEKITSFDVNKAIQRSLTKACARHGLGLYIYAGEDLPEEEAKQAKEQAEEEAKQAKEQMQTAIADACAEMRASKNRKQYEQVWRKWSAQVPSGQGSEFYNAALEVVNSFKEEAKTA